MDKENLTEEERKSITEDMITVADKIAEADLNNKKFLDRMGNKILLGVGMITLAVAAALGVNANLGAGDIPELGDNNDNDYEEV